MKLSLLLLPLIFHFAHSTPNYVTPTTPGNDFATTGCTTKSDSYVQSPIQITTPECTGYTGFDLTMKDNTDFTAPTTTNGGAKQQNYDGATLTYNGVTYKSSNIKFRTPSEHILPQNDGVASGGELQIEMADDSGSKKAVLSFLIKDIGADPTATSVAAYIASPYYYVLRDFIPASNWEFHFQTLSDLIKARVSNDAFLNFYTYEGTLTYDTCEEATWFIYGIELYGTSTLLTNILNFNGGQNNSRPMNVVGGGYGEHAAQRLCFTGYFDVYMNYNYGLWFGTVTILLFFIFTLILGDKPMKDPDYHEDVWTHQPLASIWKYGNEIHTRKSRTALILVMTTIHALFSSTFYRKASDPTKGSNIIVFAIYSMLIDLPITFFVGNLLRRYYLAKYQYYKTKEEAWEQKSQNRIFAYYIVVFAIVIVGWCFAVWNMGELHAEIDAKASNYWVASFFIGLALEMLVIYPIACILAKGSNFIRRLIKSVGFMYDAICHDTYMDYVKQE